MSAFDRATRSRSVSKAAQRFAASSVFSVSASRSVWILGSAESGYTGCRPFARESRWTTSVALNPATLPVRSKRFAVYSLRSSDASPNIGAMHDGESRARRVAADFLDVKLAMRSKVEREG